MPKPDGKSKESAAYSATEANARLGELLSRAEFGGERIRIIRRGKIAAALIGPADLERLEREKVPA